MSFGHTNTKGGTIESGERQAIGLEVCPAVHAFVLLWGGRRTLAVDGQAMNSYFGGDALKTWNGR